MVHEPGMPHGVAVGLGVGVGVGMGDAVAVAVAVGVGDGVGGIPVMVMRPLVWLGVSSFRLSSANIKLFGGAAQTGIIEAVNRQRHRYCRWRTHGCSRWCRCSCSCRGGGGCWCWCTPCRTRQFLIVVGADKSIRGDGASTHNVEASV